MSLRVICTRVLALAIAVALSGPAVSSAKVIHVKPAGLDQNDGAEWSTAKRTIQAGVNAAVSGDEVWVAAGTYLQRVVLRDAVGLYGGFQGTEKTREQRNVAAFVSKIDGQKLGSAVTVPPRAGMSTVIDGFTITNGSGTPQGDIRYGGGIYALDASLTVANNTIISNTAMQGAGLYCNAGVVLSNNRFEKNNASVFGGAALLLFGPVKVQDNTFISNRAVDGGGLALAYAAGQVTHNTFQANYGQVGGAIHNLGYHPLISGNTFSGNTGFFGVGVSCNGGSGQITANVFSANTALLSGGAVYVYSGNCSTISNNIMTGGSAQFGACVASNRSNPRIVNNTMVGNNASAGGGGVAFVEAGSGLASNNIIASGSSGFYGDIGTTPVLRTNAFYQNTGPAYSGVAGGSGDVSGDPVFIDPASADFHLMPGSPCVDAGTDADAPAVDFEGAARPLDGDASGAARCDIGAYETPAAVQTFSMNIGEVKTAVADGTTVGFSGAVVTASFPALGFLYVQSPDRSAGIRVDTSTAFPDGQIVNVTGSVYTDPATGERAVAPVDGSPVIAGDVAPAGPLSLGLEHIGGASAGLQEGIPGGTCLNNMGILVDVWGRVRYVSPAGIYFTISNGVCAPTGAPVTDQDGNVGVRVVVMPGATLPATGEYVRVRGISSTSRHADRLYPRILMPGNYSLLAPAP